MKEDEIYFAKAKESLASAKADFDSERYNSCVRGSYYACFQSAIVALLQLGVVKPRNDKWKHEFVKGQFVLQLINRKKRYDERFRETLERLSTMRQKADYEKHMLTEKDASRSFKIANEFVTHVLEGEKI